MYTLQAFLNHAAMNLHLVFISSVLVAIVGMNGWMINSLAELHRKVDNLRRDISALQRDMSSLRKEMGEVRRGIAGVRGEIGGA